MCESVAKLEQYVGKDFAPLFPKVDKVDWF